MLRGESKHHVLGWHHGLAWRNESSRIGKIGSPEVDIVVKELSVQVRVRDGVEHDMPRPRSHPKS